jgi:mannose-6-phosphate isomerase-like protein (cupin superfamily)
MKTLLLLMVSTLAFAQKPAAGDRSRVPPARVPSPYMSAADQAAAINKVDPKALASAAGGAVNIGGKELNATFRRRMAGPQYAITHPRELEYMIVIKGTATLVTGGTLIPPTLDSDPYPNPDPNALIRSANGVNGGLARKIGPGDVIINLPGTPHWFSQIDGVIDYVEIRVPNVDPAPGIERNEVAPRAK